MNILYLTVGIAIYGSEFPVFSVSQKPDRKRWTNQRVVRKNRRRRWAAGDKKAFTNHN